MKIVCLLSTTALVFSMSAPLALAEDVERAPGSESLIVGGIRVPDISVTPYQVALVDDGTRNQFCGGTLIAPEWVMTAAHCVDNFFVGMNPDRVDVVLGTLKYPESGEQIGIGEILVHPNWDEGRLDFDAALLRLEAPATLGEVVPVIAAGEELPVGPNVRVSGWGATSEGGPGSAELLMVDVPVVDTATCNEPASYDGAITDAMFCAGQRDGGKDACQGDSGGPVVGEISGELKLVGVVSWGHGCARRLKYGVYTRLTEAADWVNKQIGGSGS